MLKNKADILRENKFVYVSPNGVDSDDRDGSAAQPWRSIQYAVNRAPYVKGNYEYTVNIVGGTYSGFQALGVNIVFTLLGDVNITGSYNGGTNAIDITGSVIAIRSDNNIIRKFTVNQQGTGGGSGWYIHNNSTISSYRVAFIVNGAGKDSGVGFELASNSTLSAFGPVGGDCGRLKVVGKNIGIKSTILSKVYAERVQASNCSCGLKAETGSDIFATVAENSADTQKSADGTSRIIIG